MSKTGGGDTVDYIELVLRAKKGDRGSMDRLTLLVRDNLSVYLYRLTLNRDLTEDLLQDVLLKMVESLGMLRQEEIFWAWLYRIALNRVRTYFSEQEAGRKARMLGYRRGDSFNSGLVDYSDGLKNLIKKELSETMFTAMGELSLEHRNILVLRCFGQMPYSEIATVMNSSSLQMRALFFRAKYALKRRLAKRGFSKKWLLLALSLFARETAPAEASSADFSVPAAMLELDAPATIVGAMGTGSGIVAAVTAFVICVGVGVTAMNGGIDISVFPAAKNASVFTDDFAAVDATSRFIIEAEDYTSRANSKQSRWCQVGGSANKFIEGANVGQVSYTRKNGASGDYMEAVGKIDGQISPTSDLYDGAYLDYKVDIEKAGKYCLYARWVAIDGFSDSFYVMVLKSNGRMLTDAGPNYFMYHNASGKWELENDGLWNSSSSSFARKSQPAAWTIKKPGTYIIRILARERGAAVDMLIFQTTNLPAPQDSDFVKVQQ